MYELDTVYNVTISYSDFVERGCAQILITGFYFDCLQIGLDLKQAMPCKALHPNSCD